MYKILVVGLSNVNGGIESVIKNYYENFDHTKIQLDFICNSLEKMAYEDYFIKNGSEIFHTERRGKKPIKYLREMQRIFLLNAQKYDCLWFNTSDLANIDALKLAKKYKIPRVVIHSHNSKMIEQGLKGYVKSKLHFLHKRDIANYATDFWACSEAASNWMYPQIVEDKIHIVKNAINVQSFLFNSQKRKKIRHKYDLNGYLVLGNVGRLNFQKNQMFILDVFKQVKKIIPKSKLVLVGTGNDKDNIIKKARQLNIFNDIVFAGYQKDVQAWYSAFDIFLFPSLFEGLSVSLLEAQASGIPILASNRVSEDEVRVNDNFFTLELNKSATKWAEKLIKIVKNVSRINSDQVIHTFVDHRYEIHSEAKKIERIFLKNE